MAIDSKNEERRAFNMSDPDLYEKMNVMQNFFLNYLADFQAFDPDFTTAFATAWSQTTDFSNPYISDTMAVSEQMVMENEQSQVLKRCFTKANDVEYFAGKAFNKEKRIMAEFGFSPHERKRARATVGGCMIWLGVMKRICDLYATELAAADMPATLPAEIITLKNELETAEVNHEYSKRGRLRETRLRIEASHEIFAFYDQVHRAAEVIFVNRPEVRNLFRL